MQRRVALLDEFETRTVLGIKIYCRPMAGGVFYLRTEELSLASDIGLFLAQKIAARCGLTFEPSPTPVFSVTCGEEELDAKAETLAKAAKELRRECEIRRFNFSKRELFIILSLVVIAGLVLFLLKLAVV